MQYIRWSNLYRTKDLYDEIFLSVREDSRERNYSSRIGDHQYPRSSVINSIIYVAVI